MVVYYNFQINNKKGDTAKEQVQEKYLVLRKKEQKTDGKIENKWQVDRFKFSYINITLIVDGLNTPIKRKNCSDWIKKARPTQLYTNLATRKRNMKILIDLK